MHFCEPVLDKAKNMHLDECEAVAIQKKVFTVRITDSYIAEIKCNHKQALSVRIIHDKKILTAIENNFDSKILENVLQTKSFVKPKTFWKSLPHPSTYSRIEKTYDKRLDELTGKEAVDIANTMIQSTTDNKISRISGSLNVVSEEFEVGNTHGLECSEKSTYITGLINADSDHGNSPVSGVGSTSSRTLEAFSPDTIGKDAKEMCISSINPIKCNPGKHSIILDPYAIGELVAFVFASNFSLKTYSEKRSCFIDQLDKEIASTTFSLIDDPHSPEGIGSKPFDDEGTPTVPRHLINEGIFSNLYSDSFYAFKEDERSSGNACRLGSPMGRDAQPMPIPLPHNLKIPNGDVARKEMINDTKNGLLIGRLWYTYPVNPERGDFSCTARSGIRIIENGKITSPGKSVRIVHNLPTLLKNISSVGNNSRNVLQWNSLPTIVPTIKVEGVTVIPI